MAKMAVKAAGATLREGRVFAVTAIEGDERAVRAVYRAKNPEKLKAWVGWGQAWT